MSGAGPSLEAFLAAYLGAWPPAPGAVEVVGSPRRDEPAWDGRIQSLWGVVSPLGAVISVSPERVDEVRAAVRGRDVSQLPAVCRSIVAGDARVVEGVFRWSETPVSLPEAGVWLDGQDERVPEWLKPFGGEVLVALDDHRYVAGVGLKRHDPTGQEIAVGTEKWARGRGLARKLVAQAARRVLEQGAVVTYVHAPENHASAKVAAASGFPDLGWKALAVAGRP